MLSRTTFDQAKPTRDKSAPIVAQFLYELICKHGCFAIQINEGREFVNELSENLLEMTGNRQQVTSQSNGLLECQNQTIKNALVNVLDKTPDEWPYISEVILFAHQVSFHLSTKYSPFHLMYNREPVLPAVLPVLFEISTELWACRFIWIIRSSWERGVIKKQQEKW